MTWQVDFTPSDHTLHALLGQNRLESAYALGDLQPPFRERSQFSLAQNGAQWAILLWYRTSTFTALIPYGDAQGINAILAAKNEWPKACIVANMNEYYRQVLGQRYRFSNEQAIIRIAIEAGQLSDLPNGTQLEQLEDQHIGELSAFYTMNDVPTFSPDQLHNGLYYGVRRHGALVAVGGTHLVNSRDHLATIGNVYTDPALRGNGYVRTIIAHLTQSLFDQGCTNIIHDVKSNDFATRQIYEPLGYQQVGSFWEATARLR
ncbi:GNAT family N-acetyltransferase [Herpetosiphon giganteus]|uniref:GNAT family N-acetyltransferase n=1 Tax=Herpetosiphon giganteus TaxID=2029754 RepID=UPI00195ECFA2|nr:GNAT family N-acetyltransferase [Herpetosiphon giganteus]MBM7844825.1 putative GNAT family acetyltransferase [Herpetosiphon giganteus]